MSSPGQALPTVSVVVRTRNESQHLAYLLERLRAQNHPPLEVIVVDSGSTDGTLEIAEARADKVVRIEPEQFSFGRSLNYGCRAAGGEVFALVSAHTYPVSNNWLVNLATPFLDQEVGMVYGRQLPHADSRLGEARDFNRAFTRYSRVLLDEPVGNNANSAVRSSLWREHGFDERLTGLEDVEWAAHAQREGYVVRYAANAAIVHIHNESLPRVYRRFFREGLAWAEIFPNQRRHPATALLEAITALLRDIRFARQASAGRKLASIAGYRLCASLGAYRGELEREQRRAREARSAAARRPAPPRAVVIEARGRHSIDRREPPALQPGEASIRVASAGVCATDVEIVDGRQHYYASRRASYPIVPGHEYGGVVDAVGSPADRKLVGSRVVGECILGCRRCEACLGGSPSRCLLRREVGVLDKDGAYATHVVLPVQAIHRIPNRLPFLQAVLVEPIAVVLSALRKAVVARGERTAVVGAGPIGHLAAHVLGQFGAYVTVIDLDERRLQPLRRLDCSTAVEVSSRHLAGASTVIEATGSREVVDVIAEQSDESARVIVLGSPGEDGDPVPVRGSDRSGGPQVIGSVGSAPQDWSAAVTMISSSRLPNLAGLTDRVVPLDDYEAAWEAVRERSALKTILEVDSALARE